MRTVDSKQYIVDRWVRIFVLSLLFTTYCLLPTAPVFAQQKQTDYTLLAPIPLKGAGQGDTKKITAGPYIEGIFSLIIAVAGGLAVIMMIFGGIQYMSSDAIGGKSEGKQKIENALWGLLLAISAWLILNTINPNLVKFNFTIPPLPPSTVTPPGGPPPGGTPITGRAGNPLTDGQVKQIFTDNGHIKTNSSMANLRQGIVDELVRIQKACGCDLFINSATTGTHDERNEPVCNHKNGYKVDIASNSKFKTYIKDTYGPPTVTWAPIYKTPGGARYADEGGHWDMDIC